MRSTVRRSNKPPAASADRGAVAAAPRPCRWLDRGAPLLLALLGLLVYANSFATPFVYDGVHFILENASLRQLNPLEFTEGKSRPVSYFTFALNYAADGYHPRGFHAVNLAIHVAAACVLYGVARRTLQSAPRCTGRYAAAAGKLSLAIAALWLVHPIQTASVTYIYQRQESLMGLMYLLTLYCVLRGIQASAAGPGQSLIAGAGKWYAAAIACSLIGMGTKEVMVTAPLLALWYDRAFWAESWREIWRRRKWLYAALAATAAMPVGFVLLKSKEYQAVGLLVSHVHSPWEYARSQPGVICHYLWLCVNPQGLCLDPNWPVAQTAAEVVPPAALIVLLLALTAWCVWKHPGWGFIAGSFFVILSPTSTVLPILDLAYDHRMYLSLAALSVLAVLGGYEGWNWLSARSAAPALRRTWVLPALATFVVAVFAAETIFRNEDYRTTIAIWEDAVKKAPHNPRAHYSLGRDLHAVANGDPRLESLALEEADQALKLVSSYGDAHGLRGTVLERLGTDAESQARAAESQGRSDEAARHGAEAKQQLTEAEREFRWVIEHDPKNADGWANLGNVFARRDQPEEAIKYYDRALQVDPNNALAHSNRGLALLHLNHPPEAVEELRRGIALDNTHSHWFFMLAAALAGQEKFDDAIRTLQDAVAARAADVNIYCELGIFQTRKKDWIAAEQSFRQGLALAPDDVPTMLNLADLLVRRGRQSEAINYYEQVLARRPENVDAHTLLGQILAEQGATDEAARHFRSALAAAPNHKPAQEGLDHLGAPRASVPAAP